MKVKKITKNKGFSKMLILLVIALILVGGGGILYFMSQKGQGNTVSTLIGKTLNPNCEYKDPDLCKFFNSWKVMSDYSVKSTSKAGGVNTQSVFEINGSDKSHIMMLENGKESFNVITIGDATYTKDYTDNKWFKQVAKQTPGAIPTSSKNSPNITFDDKKQIAEKIEYKTLGKEACGNLTCFKYQEITPSDSGTITYLWFDDRQYLLRKESTTDKDGNVNESIFSYNHVSITVPSPIKEGTPGAGFIPGVSGADVKAIEQAQKDAANTAPAGY